MTELILERIYLGKDYTIGRLYINKKYFCDTLEDIDRKLTSSMSPEDVAKIKIKDQTAIPTGLYKVVMNFPSPKYSNFNKYKWAKPYGGKLPRLLDVNGFSGVLIHPGNTKEDTSGCILVGENKVVGKVVNSVETYKKLMNILLKDKDNISLIIRYPKKK